MQLLDVTSQDGSRREIQTQEWGKPHTKPKIIRAPSGDPPNLCKLYSAWNLDLTNYQGTKKMRLLFRGFVKSQTSKYRNCMKIIQMLVISK